MNLKKAVLAVAVSTVMATAQAGTIGESNLGLNLSSSGGTTDSGELNPNVKITRQQENLNRKNAIWERQSRKNAAQAIVRATNDAKVAASRAMTADQRGIKIISTSQGNDLGRYDSTRPVTGETGDLNSPILAGKSGSCRFEANLAGSNTLDPFVGSTRRETPISPFGGPISHRSASSRADRAELAADGYTFLGIDSSYDDASDSTITYAVYQKQLEPETVEITAHAFVNPNGTLVTTLTVDGQPYATKGYDTSDLLFTLGVTGSGQAKYSLVTPAYQPISARARNGQAGLGWGAFYGHTLYRAHRSRSGGRGTVYGYFYAKSIDIGFETSTLGSMSVAIKDMNITHSASPQAHPLHYNSRRTANGNGCTIELQ